MDSKFDDMENFWGRNVTNATDVSFFRAQDLFTQVDPKFDDIKILWDESVLVNAFSKILELCPSAVLEEAKGRRDVYPSANDFIKLDHEMRIEKDDEGVKRFADIVFLFVESLAEIIGLYLNELELTVTLAGSFPLNLKILNLDEFDFVLILVYKILHIPDLPNLKLVKIIREIFNRCKDNQDFSELNLLIKHHALNLIFSWKCLCNDQHSLSLDLAISLMKATTVGKYFTRKNFPLKGTPFENAIHWHENICWNYYIDFDQAQDERIDTNIFDKQMFAKCDVISPNIKLCYRILKFICAHTFPYKRKSVLCQLKNELVEYQKPVYSSYILKQLLFREIIDFGTSEDWRNDVVHIRLASILDRVLRFSSVKDLIDEDSETLLDEIEGHEKLFKKALLQLAEWLRKGCRSISLKPEFRKSNNNNDVTITAVNPENSEKLNHTLSPCVKISANESVLENLYKSCFYDHYLYYKFKTLKPNLIASNIFCGIYHSFCSVFDQMRNIDLTAFKAIDAEKIILLLSCDIITEEDFGSTNYVKKLNVFNEMVDSYSISHIKIFRGGQSYRPQHEFKFNFDLRLYYFDLFPDFPRAIFQDEVSMKMSWKEAGYIFKNITNLTNIYSKESKCRKIQFLIKSILNRLSPQYSLQENWLVASLIFIAGINKKTIFC